MPFLQIEQLNIGYHTGRKYFPVQHDLNLSAKKGELIALIGTNGCGKSTLLRSLSGLQPIADGVVSINGENIFEKTPKQRARIISVVLTEHQSVASFTVKELIAIGRDPYSGWIGKMSEKDDAAIEKAITMTSLKGFEHRKIHHLSDGERQRVFIARALAQDTLVILLDEPTSHLDLPNRIHTLLLLKKLSEETGKIIIFSTHELEIALQVADKVWLMEREKGVKVGTPEDLILSNVIDTVFRGETFRFDKETGNFVLYNQVGKSVRFFPRNNRSKLSQWTRKALLRKGFSIEENALIHIEMNESEKNWRVFFNEKEEIVNSIEDMLHVLGNFSK